MAKADGAKTEGPRSAMRFLENIADGRLAAQLSAKLFRLGAKLVEESLARDAKVKGELTLRLKFEAKPDGVTSVDYELKVKEPAEKTAQGTTWLTTDGNFVFENPRQPQLPGLREVSRPREAREVDERPAAPAREV